MSIESRMRRLLAERTKFLPDGEAEDREGSMTKGQLKFIGQLAAELNAMLQDDDQIPGWVQNQISVAEENLVQAYSYMKPRSED